MKPVFTIRHEFKVRQVTFHKKGDYVASVCPDAESRGVIIHHLGKKQSQCPFKRTKGKVQVRVFGLAHGRSSALVMLTLLFWCSVSCSTHQSPSSLSPRVDMFEFTTCPSSK